MTVIMSTHGRVKVRNYKSQVKQALFDFSSLEGQRRKFSLPMVYIILVMLGLGEGKEQEFEKNGELFFRQISSHCSRAV